jgi:hypothetical protein
MNEQLRKHSTPILRLFAFTLALLCAACSGGISGSGGLPAGRSAGPIDGFGSVIVNGVAFDSSSATITKEGMPASEGELRVGQVIELEGDFDTNVATSISYRSEIKGPVTSVIATDLELWTGTLEVLGQTVHVNTLTVFDGTSLELIAPGDLLEVSGPRDTSGAVVATYLEDKSTLDEYKLVGTVANVDTIMRTFELGGLDVDYLTADIEDMPEDPSTWNDALVEVKGDPLDFNPGTNLLVASEVEQLTGLSGTEGERIELEGYITNFVSAAEFDVLGYPVRTSASTDFSEGSSASLANNVKVQVKGTVAADGVLEAESVEIQATGSVRAEWEVESVDLAGSTFTVLGIEWEVRATTEIEDDSNAEVDPFTLADLSPGDLVEVRGYMEGSMPIASRLERDEPQTDASLRGPVTSVDGVGSFEFEILGLAVRGDAMTVYRDEDDVSITQAEFFAALSLGVLVGAEWDPYLGMGAPADELCLEDD